MNSSLAPFGPRKRNSLITNGELEVRPAITKSRTETQTTSPTKAALTARDIERFTWAKGFDIMCPPGCGCGISELVNCCEETVRLRFLHRGKAQRGRIIFLKRKMSIGFWSGSTDISCSRLRSCDCGLGFIQCQLVLLNRDG